MLVGQTRNPQQRWYAVRTHAHRERFAAENLRRQGFEVFLPVEIRTVRHARQFRTVQAAFFPGYLFVSFDVKRDTWRRVTGTMGVSQLVMAAGLPVALPRDIVPAMRSVADDTGALRLETVAAGQHLSIKTGPFAGLAGELASRAGPQRVKVLLDILGKRTAVALNAADLGVAA
jgi:transcriptional antiterminator RfaH